jgi:Predicted glycosyltransferases
MISVLIPVYQRVVVDLVGNLLSQLRTCDIPFEIVLVDDGSEMSIREANRVLQQLPQVRYVELEKNVGRSAIRNILANEAVYDQLLFLDCDVALPDDLFIERYINVASKKHVTVGGIKYRDEVPFDKSMYLRWKYGHKREAISLKMRREKPYASFMTANFCISRTLFLKIKFSNSIIGYGHEDTLFGFELAKLRIPILHIDNPVFHDGLESALDFLAKSDEAVRNLFRLYRSNSPRVNINNVALLEAFVLIQRFHARLFVVAFYKIALRVLRKNLVGGHPSIFIFSLYKIGYFCQLYGHELKYTNN